MPIGMPGWPDFAASTASIASARMALASASSGARCGSAETEAETVAVSDIRALAGEGKARPETAAARREGVENYRESTTFVQ